MHGILEKLLHALIIFYYKPLCLHQSLMLSDLFLQHVFDLFQTLLLLSRQLLYLLTDKTRHTYFQSELL